MGSEVGEKEGEGIRKGSRAGTQTRVSRSTVYVGTRLLTLIYPEFFPAPQNRPYLLFPCPFLVCARFIGLHYSKYSREIHHITEVK